MRHKRGGFLSRSGKPGRIMLMKLAGSFLAVLLVFVCLLLRVLYIDAVKGEEYSEKVLERTRNMYLQAPIVARRGDILDTNGNVLATSAKKYRIIMDVKLIGSTEIRDGQEIQPYLEPTLRALVGVYGFDREDLLGIFTQEKKKDLRYYALRTVNSEDGGGKAIILSVSDKERFSLYLSNLDEQIEVAKNALKEIPDDEEHALERAQAKARLDGPTSEKKGIVGISFEEIYERQYPFGSLGVEVIGLASKEGGASGYGLESYYNDELTGQEGRRYSYWNEDASDYIQRSIIQPAPGNTLVTSLDINIERMVKEEIDRYMDLYDNYVEERQAADHVGVIVMNPQNGQVLAMAADGSFDPNMSADTPKGDETMLKVLANYCISAGYEPGSTIKPVTVCAALETGCISEEAFFMCDGFEMFDDTKIKCAEEDGHGLLSLTEVISNSCNDGIMQLAAKTGKENLNRYQHAFGFGAKTGIDLSGEASGILFRENEMSNVELATAAFGQGINCTMIQEAAAIASIANGGSWYRPSVVREIRDADGVTIREKDALLERKTVSPENAEFVKNAMREAVESGTARYAKVNGYSMGGKTGTAEKLPRGKGDYLVSFIGFVPYENPQLLIYVVVDEPNLAAQDDSRFPQWIARNILEKILPYMGIEPDEELREENEIILSDIDNP